MMKKAKDSVANAPVCPKCGMADVIPVCYGYPLPETVEQSDCGEVVLGGCCVEPGQPNWHCKKCEYDFSLFLNKFDAFIMVDWSANKTPKNGKDSIWVCEGGQDGVSDPENFSTRNLAIQHITELIQGSLNRNERILVGFDFAFGYPEGFSAMAWGTGGEKPWKRTWRALQQEVTGDTQDVKKGSFDRFAYAAKLNTTISKSPMTGPFWGCPSKTDAISKKRPDPFPFKQYRITESRRGVQETWKLFYRGGVGSQTLLGIPRVAELRFGRFKDCSQVWPFETGFSLKEMKKVVFAEIWPGTVENALLKTAGSIRDEKQVRAMVNWCCDQDLKGNLEKWFEWTGESEKDRKIALSEEGWILGVRGKA